MEEFAAGLHAAQRCISALLVSGWKPCIDRLIRVGADLEIGAMMVGVAAVRIPAMGPHKLDHLQPEFRAVDVRNLGIAFLIVIKRWHAHSLAAGKKPSPRRIVN